jgi:hypothetical protein
LHVASTLEIQSNRLEIAQSQALRSRRADAGRRVGWLGAMQAQDYPGAKWAVGQRAGVNDRAIERAFNQGAILRTHLTIV